MRIAGLSRKQIRRRLGELGDQVNDKFADLLLQSGFDDTNDIPYWRWCEMIVEAGGKHPDGSSVATKTQKQ